jgi:predicted ribosome quality control (RQC) complex YloA/Tae2 family protein
MFHNFFFLQHLAAELDKKLAGAILVECFSQQKDELVLAFLLPDKEDFYIKATLDNEVNLIAFQDDFRRARKNSVDLFPALKDKSVDHVRVVRFDRSFYLKFEDQTRLLFKLHGNRSNIILLNSAGEHELFKSKLQQDETLQLEDIAKNIRLSQQMSEEDVLTLQKVIGKESQEYLEANYSFSELTISEKARTLLQLIAQFEKGEFFILENGKPTLTLFADPKATWQSNSALEAANVLYKKTVSGFLFEKERNALLQSIKQKIKKSENYISKNQQKLKEIEDKRSNEEIANIIMANLHVIPKNAKVATVNDVYTNQPIEIKLKRDLSPQKNAEQYYRKAKNEKIERQKIQENIDQKEELVLSLYEEIEEIEKMDSIRELRKHAEKYRNTASTSQQTLPYKTFEYQGYEIRVGKSAAANDQLTLKHAHKEDIWLHARDVAGSHVIVRSKKAKLPNPVLEYAAGLAAYYSKRKNDTLCPVIYTPRKYVRKGRGMAPGLVIVEKEEVVMVPPTPPSSII